MTNVFLAHNTAGASSDLFNGDNGVSLLNHSAIGDASGSSLSATGAGNLIDVATTPAITGALASNGGPTQTMVPLSNSLLVDSAGSVAASAQAVGNADTTLPGGELFSSSLPTLSIGVYATIQIGNEQLGVTGVAVGSPTTASNT